MSVLAISFFALFGWKRFPFVFTGWFWFVGTLVPVIGLVQVGSTSRADRYTYLPQIGLLIAVVWLAAALTRNRAVLQRSLAVVAGVAIVTSVGLCFRQVSYWRDPITLFTHTVKVSPHSANALFNLGVGYAMAKQPQRAEPVFRRAAELNPEGLGIMQNWAASLIEIGKPREAIEVLTRLIELDDGKPEHYYQLGLAYYGTGDYAEAIFQAGEALRIEPEFQPALHLIEKSVKSLPPKMPVQ
jgi:tetratricopeptide (TPR) repeat protein